MSRSAWFAGLTVVVLVYLHNALPYLTAMPRVNVDEPWLMERGYQVMRTGVPSQPMLGLDHAYLLQVGYGYLLAVWMAIFGVGILQARLLAVVLGLGIITMVATVGRRALDPVAGLGAALFLALDSNFLGGVRSARTDIPSVFFVAGAFAAYVRGRRLSRPFWFAVSGASLGLGVLCHGNAFWAGLILLAWYVVDYGRDVFVLPYGYALIAGALVTFGPYLAVVLWRWSDVQAQIANFAADRVPGWRPSFVVQQILRESERYRGWYFGLVTAIVPNPLLRVFQFSTIVGVGALAARAWRMRRGTAETTPDEGDRNGALRLLILAVGGALVFAALINNKVPVYIPHILIGFSLAAGAAVSDAVTVIGRANRSALALAFLVAYGAAGVAYYEKWYSTARKSELVSYESTDATLRTLVPAGPKYVFASPQFWTTFHDQPSTTFYSFAAAQPVDSESAVALRGADDERPIVLLVDELQWLPELVGASSSTLEWQRSWIAFIEQRCGLDAVAYGTAHGTIAAYRCSLASPPLRTRPRIVGAASQYTVGPPVLEQQAADLAGWDRYVDPRRTTASHPEVTLDAGRLRISGTGWPGIVKTVAVAAGEPYLVRVDASGARDGDLLYLGTWQSPQVESLSGASAAGIPAPLALPRWFPADRAFRATAAGVRVLVYSEAPQTDFSVSSLDIFRLVPASGGR